jgi:hypothetical protein
LLKTLTFNSSEPGLEIKNFAYPMCLYKINLANQSNITIEVLELLRKLSYRKAFLEFVADSAVQNRIGRRLKESSLFLKPYAAEYEYKMETLNSFDVFPHNMEKARGWLL